jgi:hypothetical protein
MAGRIRGEQRMLTALADSKRATRRTGFSVPKVFGAVPKAAFAALGAIVLTGGAMTASAAAGGPNVPAALLAAVGLEHLGPLSAAESGIDETKASPTGFENANQNAKDGGAVNSEQKGDNRKTPAAGGESNASANGLEHRDAHAGDGGNGPESGSGDSNASETGKEKANQNAADGAQNAEDQGGNRATSTPAAGLTNTGGPKGNGGQP